jgi:hypothetical protein
VADAGQRAAGAADAKVFFRKGYGISVNVVNTDLTVMKVGGLCNNSAPRIEIEVTSFRFFKTFHLQANMIEAYLHARFVQARPAFEEGEVIKAIGNGDISLLRPPDFSRAQEPVVEFG